MDVQQANAQDVVSQTHSAVEPVIENISEQDRKRARLTQQLQSAQSFFGIVFRGLTKIIEEISSLILKR